MVVYLLYKILDILAERRIKNLCNRSNVSWLKDDISCHNFPNLEQKCYCDANKKIMIHVYSQDYQNTKCLSSQEYKLVDEKYYYKRFFP